MLENSQIQNTQQTINSQDNITQDLITVLQREKESIQFLIQNFPKEAKNLVEIILKTRGRVVFSGMGKSGIVCKKLVATFSSMGTPSLFLHPGEALHGDLGMIQSQDIFIAISKSGTGNELEQIIPLLKSQGIITCLISCANGKLCNQVDFFINLPFKNEACELNLAPTSSSTLCMAFGDAIAIVVSKLKGFGKNDFAKFHPAGALGKRLLLKVSSLMCKDDLPLIKPETNFKDLLLEISSKKLGIGIVIDQNKKLLGIITDGDLRRSCNLGPEIFTKTAVEIMTVNPKTISNDALAYNALQKMEEFNITSLVVTQEENIVSGIIHIHDLVKAGITS